MQPSIHINLIYLTLMNKRNFHLVVVVIINKFQVINKNLTMNKCIMKEMI